MNPADRFVMNHASMAPPQFVTWLDDAATLQAAHIKISTLMDSWVPTSPQFRDHKENIESEWQKALALNLRTTKGLQMATAAAVEDVYINAAYLVIRAKNDRDETWLYNNGFTLKEKTKRVYARPVSLFGHVLRVKNGPQIGEVTVSWDKDPGAGSYQLQICKGHPQGEESFEDYGQLTLVRTIIAKLERANWYYFRVRSVGNNEYGPWSEPVAIIIT